ncbi:hypothetical protein AQZ49_14450 [Novosphingobium sp. FSW06-99]|nr:hypothetical protein [Novosphingobium sp. FSW06-99]KUR75657.1 hypothetical protein AQZ49_14450 [Novosphingobium sp. FSW06-99]
MTQEAFDLPCRHAASPQLHRHGMTQAVWNYVLGQSCLLHDQLERLFDGLDRLAAPHNETRHCLCLHKRQQRVCDWYDRPTLFGLRTALGVEVDHSVGESDLIRSQVEHSIGSSQSVQHDDAKDIDVRPRLGCDQQAAHLVGVKPAPFLRIAPVLNVANEGR